MKILLKISWRNVWRNPKRSLIMIIAIMLGLWAGIFVSALSFGLLEQRFKTSIEQHVSHMQIHNPQFLENHDVKYGIRDWESLIEELGSDEGVKAFSGRTMVNGMLATATLTRGVNIIGIDPESEAQTTGLDKNVIAGSYLVEEANNQILVGRALAEKTRLQERSRLVLTFQNVEGELISVLFRVTGIFQSSNSMLDERNIYVLRSNLNEYISHDTLINEIAIIGHNFEGISEIADKYAQQFPELTIRTWSEISPELSYMQGITRSMLLIILAIILFALAFGLVNTMLMSVFERIRELGMLMAVGLNRKKIFAMIMFETSYLTLLGASGGMLLGIITMNLTKRSGIDLAAVGGDSLNEFGFSSLVYPHLDASFFIMLSVLVVITAFLTSIYPALKALRLKPAEAVRTE